MRRTFAPNGKLTAFAIVFLPILVGLGSWQTQRASEKAVIEAELEARGAVPPRTLERSAVTPDNLERVRVSGQFVPEAAVLLDNRTHQGQVGYELFVPLRSSGDERALLVNLGWLAAPRIRTELPGFRLPPGVVRISGTAVQQWPAAPIYGEAVETVGAVLRVQRVDVDEMAGALAMDLAPWVLVADADQPGAQRWNFRPVRMSSSTHRGYAAQWFGLAGVLFIGWLIVSFRRREEDGEAEQS